MLKTLHVGISVRNIEESIEWYKNKLGFELLQSKDFEELKSKIASVKREDFEIELFEHHKTIAIPEERLMPKSDIQTQGTKHLTFVQKIF